MIKHTGFSPFMECDDYRYIGEYSTYIYIYMCVCVCVRVYVSFYQYIDYRIDFFGHFEASSGIEKKIQRIFQ